MKPDLIFAALTAAFLFVQDGPILTAPQRAPAADQTAPRSSQVELAPVPTLSPGGAYRQTIAPSASLLGLTAPAPRSATGQPFAFDPAPPPDRQADLTPPPPAEDTVTSDCRFEDGEFTCEQTDSVGEASNAVAERLR